MLLMPGNVLPNPGPYNRCCPTFTTPTGLKSRSGLGFIHVNIRSLLPKLDMVHIWARNTNADVIVISEFSIIGYNVFRADRPKRGGGVVIYVKECFETITLFSESVTKQHELLALNLTVSKSCQLTIVGCYRPP